MPRLAGDHDELAKSPQGGRVMPMSLKDIAAARTPKERSRIARLGGLAGGVGEIGLVDRAHHSREMGWKAAANMTPEQRRERASRAGKARWAKVSAEDRSAYGRWLAGFRYGGRA